MRMYVDMLYAQNLSGTVKTAKEWNKWPPFDHVHEKQKLELIN